jgi:hypothetical protein
VPRSAELIVHCRTLPGFTVTDVIEEIKSFVDLSDSADLEVTVLNESSAVFHQTMEDPKVVQILDIISEVNLKS